MFQGFNQIAIALDASFIESNGKSLSMCIVGQVGQGDALGLLSAALIIGNQFRQRQDDLFGFASQEHCTHNWKPVQAATLH